jgi:hypothetical protein
MHSYEDVVSDIDDYLALCELRSIMLKRRFGGNTILLEQMRHDRGNVRPLVTSPTTDECAMPPPLLYKNP